MDSKNKKIDLIELIPRGTHIVINNEFRAKLFTKIFKKYTKPELVNKFGYFKRTYYSWSNGEIAPTLKVILDLVNDVGINSTELFSSIESVTSFYKSGSIRLKNFKIPFDSAFAEWFGLVKGDGCINKKYVDCANTKLQLALQFTSFLEKIFGIEKSQFEITLKLPIDKTEDDFKDVISSIKQNGFNRIVITEEPKFKERKRRKLLFVARFNSKLLATIMSKIQNNLYSLLLNSPNDVKAAFIRGYCAAEGSVGERRVTIAQNDAEELKFIKELLVSLGFKHVSNPERVGRGYRISIYTKWELERFYSEIGFGMHKERNKKLKELIDSYVYNYEWHMTQKERYQEILNIIKKYSRITAPFIRTKTNIVYKYVSQLLKEMVNLGMISVNKNSKPYIYFVRDVNENTTR
jgi:predicted transcriptional regulator